MLLTQSPLAVLEGFSQVVCLDGIGAVEVGDCPG